MKDNRCFICKYKQVYRAKASDDAIYDAKGHSVTISLCHGHSVELFKAGQKSFILRHSHIFEGHFGVENDAQLMNFFSPNREKSWFY